MPGQIEGVKTGQSLEPSQADLIDSFARGLRARNRSARTIKSYCDTANRFVAFLQDRGMPTSTPAVTREPVEDYLADQLDRFTPSTAATRYRCLQQYFRWLDDEGEIAASPMAKMSPPRVADKPVDVVDESDTQQAAGLVLGEDLRRPAGHGHPHALHRHGHVLLADVFREPYGDIAAAVGKREGACRQIASRVRRKVRPPGPRMSPQRAGDHGLFVIGGDVRAGRIVALPRPAQPPTS